MIFARRFGYYLMLRRAKIFGHRSQNNAPYCFVHCVRTPFIFSQKSKKAPSNEDAFLFFWRRERDSNPRVLAHKLISSQPRYDHFDISPYMIKLKRVQYFKVILRGAPLCPVAVPKICLLAFRSSNFDRCHSFLLAYSATGSARKRPHFDISPY